MSSESHAKAQLSAWVEAHYAFDRVTLDEVSEGRDVSKQTYFVQDDGTRCAALTAYPPDSQPSDLGNLVDILLALQLKDFPAEQIIPTNDGEPVLEVDGWRLMAKSYVDGFPVEPDISSFRRVGRLLGRLQTLFTPSELVRLPKAQRTIEQQTARARRQLEQVRDRLPDESRSLYDAVEAALKRVHPCVHVPDVLIHNDFHLTNIINTRANEIKVIDWDGAGRDTAVTDLGFLLSSAHPRPLADETTAPDPARIEAIVLGYRQNRSLSAAELNCLPGAILLRVLERLATNFVTLVEQGERDPEQAWWEARFEYADETARLARVAFEQPEVAS